MWLLVSRENFLGIGVCHFSILQQFRNWRPERDFSRQRQVFA